MLRKNHQYFKPSRSCLGSDAKKCSNFFLTLPRLVSCRGQKMRDSHSVALHQGVYAYKWIRANCQGNLMKCWHTSIWASRGSNNTTTRHVVGSCILWGASIVISADISVDASIDMSVATRSSIGRYSIGISADSRSSIG